MTEKKRAKGEGVVFILEKKGLGESNCILLLPKRGVRELKEVISASRNFINVLV